MSGMRANGRVDHNESAKRWLMISKNVSREERNTIEAIDLKRLLTDRLGYLPASRMERLERREIEPSGSLRITIWELARWRVGNQIISLS
jgi:hypothetical protein